MSFRIDEGEREALERVWKSKTFFNGPETQALEKEFAEKMGEKHGIAIVNAMSVMFASLRAAGVNGPKDEVVVAANYFFPAAAVLYANGTPVFADCDPMTWNVNPEDVEKKITEKTRAIVPCHMFGLPSDMDHIMEIAEKHDLVVVEDAAQANGSKYKGRYTGSIGTVGSFSFCGKSMTTGHGGMGTTNDDFMDKAIRHIRGDGWLGGTVPAPPFLSWNLWCTEFMAAVARVQLSKLDRMIEETQKNARLYDEVLDGCNWLTPQYVPKDCTSAYYGYHFLFEGDKVGIKRDDFVKALQDAGCRAGYMDPVAYLPTRNYYAASGWGKCPVIKKVYEKGIFGAWTYSIRFNSYEEERQGVSANAEAMRKAISSLKK